VLNQITPIVLTKNEAPNIERTLSRLTWARDIVVVDSYSDDETVELVSSVPQARVVQRKFDTHAAQWDFALNQTGVSTEWVLALDADYVLSEQLVDEIASLVPSPDTAGYRAGFQYVIQGHPLRGSAYPPVTILYRRTAAQYLQDGHTQRVVVRGRVESLMGSVLHDDRKSLGHWFEAQRRYMKLEAEKLAGAEWGQLAWKDRLRKLKVATPIAIGFYCLFVKGAVLDGRWGVFYSLQRVCAEVLLSLYLFEVERAQPAKVAARAVEVAAKR
jgi:glycosyltransferase involved in cell wall biosynthesis